MDGQIRAIKTWLGSGAVNLFGKPFSGKDTQGEALARLLNAPLIGGGDILRSHSDPVQVERAMASGGLVPSDYFFDLVLPYLSRGEFNGKPLVLDALGRSAGEEETIMRAAAHSGHPLKAVLLLDVPDDEVWARFAAAKKSHDRDGRSDDQRKTLQNRLQKFQEKTVPVIDFYRKKGLLVTVDGAGERNAVTQKLIAALAGCVK